MGSMYTAILFLGVQNASSVQPVVAVERTVFYRERAAGMYSAMPYAFAQVHSILPIKTSIAYNNICPFVSTHFVRQRLHFPPLWIAQGRFHCQFMSELDSHGAHLTLFCFPFSLDGKRKSLFDYGIECPNMTLYLTFTRRSLLLSCLNCKHGLISLILFMIFCSSIAGYY